MRREAWRLEQELADARSANSSGPSSLAVSASAPGGSYDYQMFYDDLAPLGTWFDSPDYGYVGSRRFV